MLPYYRSIVIAQTSKSDHGNKRLLPFRAEIRPLFRTIEITYESLQRLFP